VVVRRRTLTSVCRQTENSKGGRSKSLNTKGLSKEGDTPRMEHNAYRLVTTGPSTYTKVPGHNFVHKCQYSIEDVECMCLTCACMLLCSGRNTTGLLRRSTRPVHARLNNH
jgi:hypothetical protein